MGFFTRHKGRGSYNLLSSYSHFMPGFSDLAWIVIMLIAGTVLGSLILSAFMFTGYEHLIATYGILIAYPMMFIPAMLFASAKSRRNEGFEDGYTIDNNNFGTHKGYTMAFAVIVMSIATAFVIEPVSMLLPDMPEELAEELAGLLNGPAWVTFLSVSIFAPFFEEWLCRGIVLRGLLKKAGPVWAIILSALFFAAIHMNLWQAIPAFLMGLLFGYVYYKTGSLKLVMLMHFTNNTMAFITSVATAGSDAEYFKDLFSPWAYAGIYAASVVIILSGVVLMKGITQKDGNLGGCRKIPSIF